MSVRRLAGALLASTMLAAVAFLSPGADPGTPGDDVARLLDPTYVAASVCSGAAKRDEMFKPGFAAVRAAAAATMEAGAADRPMLYDNLGNLTFPITTREPMAQRWFDQGYRLAWAFNHEEARRAFKEAQRLDPTCAMCAWGEAWVLGPNINAPMDEAAVQPAFNAVARAQALAGGASEVERALITATARRYSPDPAADRKALDAAYADALTEVARRHPDHVEAQLLLADALMNLSPWDYWQADRQTPKGRTAEIVAALDTVLQRNPDHPGAIHLYIHAVEATTTPERAAAHADRLATLMPGAGHIVHMPSHLYFRIGRFKDSLELNRAAVAADEAYLRTAPAAEFYRSTYYPHNVHFLLTSAQMAGDGATALSAAEKLRTVVSDEVAEQIGWVQVIKTAPYFLHAQMSEPKTVLDVPSPGGRFPVVLASWHYARGVALAQLGDAAGAKAEAAAVAKIAAEGDHKGLVDGGVPAPDILLIAQKVLEGRIAQAEGNAGAAARAFQAAADVEATMPYMEPPYWYYPVHQSLGAALLEAGKPAEAEAAFRTALRHYPGNAWALYGLMKAQEAMGDTAGATATRKSFEAAWAGRGTPDLARL